MCVDLGAGKRAGGGWLQGSAGILARRGSYFHAALLALHAAGARLLVRSPGSGALGLRFIGHGDDRLERAARETFTRSPGEARKGAMACIAMWGARVASPHPNIRRKRQGSGSTIPPTRPSCPCVPCSRSDTPERGSEDVAVGSQDVRKHEGREAEMALLYPDAAVPSYSQSLVHRVCLLASAHAKTLIFGSQPRPINYCILSTQGCLNSKFYIHALTHRKSRGITLHSMALANGYSTPLHATNSQSGYESVRGIHRYIVPKKKSVVIRKRVSWLRGWSRETLLGEGLLEAQDTIAVRVVPSPADQCHAYI